jgi:hypothetical protein
MHLEREVALAEDTHAGPGSGMGEVSPDELGEKAG